MTWSCGRCGATGQDDGELEYTGIGDNEVAVRCPKCHRSIRVMLVREMGADSYEVRETDP